MFKRLWKKFLVWLTNTSFYYFIIMRIIPYIRFTTYYTSMKGREYHKAYARLKPGHIILTVDKKKLTSLLIPGEFTHSGYCVSLDKEWETSEMTHHDYEKSTFVDMCFQSDRVVILECLDFDEDYIKRTINMCKSLQTATYDVKFSAGIKMLYCSELVYASDFERRLDVSLEDLAGLGTPYISPTGLYKAKNIRVIYDTGKR